MRRRERRKRLLSRSASRNQEREQERESRESQAERTGRGGPKTLGGRKKQRSLEAGKADWTAGREPAKTPSEQAHKDDRKGKETVRKCKKGTVGAFMSRKRPRALT